MYLVLNITNYDLGYDIGGLYRSYDKAVERLLWLRENGYDEIDDGNSWRIVEVENMKKNAEPQRTAKGQE